MVKLAIVVFERRVIMQQNFREQVVFQQINTMRQLTTRLRQAEQRNAQLLEQLNQAESFTSQELGRLDQMLTQLEAQISQASRVEPGYQQNYGQSYGSNPGQGQGTYGNPSYTPTYNPSQYGSSYSSQFQNMGESNQNKQ